jgi:DNA polymerase-3 subunit epsilon
MLIVCLLLLVILIASAPLILRLPRGAKGNAAESTNRLSGNRNQPPGTDDIAPLQYSSTPPHASTTVSREATNTTSHFKHSRSPACRFEKRTFEIPHLLAVIDLETTGFSAGMDEIIEIGALKYDRATDSVLEFSTLVRPTRPISRGITSKTGITQEMVDRDGVSLCAGVRQLLAFIEQLPFLGYNVDFDARFLKCASDQYGLGLSNLYLDILAMVREAYPNLPSHRLEDVARMLNLSAENTHRALADCPRTLAVFQHVVDKVRPHHEWRDPRNIPVIEPNQPRSAAYEAMLNHIGSQISAQEGNEKGHFRGETVVFTGDLSIPRTHAADLAVTAGCNVALGVTRHTTILVTGVRDPSLYGGKEKSGKLLKAEELVAEGLPLRILKEAEFFQLIGSRI